VAIYSFVVIVLNHWIIICRGAPDRNEDDTVKMIRHDHEFVDLDRCKFTVQFKPPSFNHPPGVIQSHLTRRYVAEQTRPILCADGHEIRSRLSVIVTHQPDRAAATFFRVVFHVLRLSGCACLDDLLFVRLEGEPAAGVVSVFCFRSASPKNVAPGFPCADPFH
jgi:hypothetical protein